VFADNYRMVAQVNGKGNTESPILQGRVGFQAIIAR
jgi:hypothetical protein